MTGPQDRYYIPVYILSTEDGIWFNSNQQNISISLLSQFPKVAIVNSTCILLDGSFACTNMCSVFVYVHVKKIFGC